MSVPAPGGPAVGPVRGAETGEADEEGGVVPGTTGPVVAERARVLARRTGGLRAAALTRGPAELLDFVVPLWAGPAVGAGPAVVGQLVAVELLVSVVARPLAGRWADAVERRTLAALGALVYAISCVGYAGATATHSLPLAFVAAVVGGLGGSLLWVSLRAMVAEGHAEDGSGFARLLRAEETGTWVAFVGGLSLVTGLGFAGLFVLCAASCLVGAACLVLVPRGLAGVDDSSTAPVPDPDDGRRLRPWLLAAGTVAVGEGAIGLVLLLHLQRGLGLGVVETAYVFLPGAVALAVLPPALHRVVVRVGRRAALVGAGLLSATFAVALAFSGSPWAIAAWWLLTGVAWAVVMPLEQAVLAEASPRRLGRVMGSYEAALLLGGAVGSAVAGWAYERGSWELTCLGAAAVVLVGTAFGPWALARTGVADRPAAPDGVPA